MEFLSNPADVVIGGGSAFGGKTFALLLECLRHVDNGKFSAVIFRRVQPQIMAEGGLWDTASSLYGGMATPGIARKDFTFPSGASIRLAQMQHEHNIHDWDGAQVPLICWDQLEQFTWKQFSYLFKCLRSDSGVTPYVRASCNPEPDGWLRRFLSWWIDDETGYAIPERSGVIRWFSVVADVVTWGDTEAEVKSETGQDPKSCTFIPFGYRDNIIGMKQNPGYVASLDALPLVERMQQKEGNWNIRASAGNVFRKDWFDVVSALPAGLRFVRYWDRAATKPTAQNPDPDWTVGAKLGCDEAGIIYVADIARIREAPAGAGRLILATASQDGPNVEIGLEQEPGASGKGEAHYMVRQLAGYNVRAYPKRASKLVSAGPLAAQAEVGNVKLLRAPWNDVLLAEFEGFPDGAHDDIVDAASGAAGMLFGSASRWLPVKAALPAASEADGGITMMSFGGNGNGHRNGNDLGLDERPFYPIGRG